MHFIKFIQPPKPQPQQKPVAHSPIIDPDSFSDTDFVNPLPPELHCVLCKMVPRKPRCSKCCNTLYCEPCSKKQELCPVHKQKKEYTADSDLRNKVHTCTCVCMMYDSIFPKKNSRHYGSRFYRRG